MRRVITIASLLVAAAIATTALASSSPASTSSLAGQLALARSATAKYVTGLGRARADGYKLIITQMVPNMGYHYMNPNVKGFDIGKPPILVYQHRGGVWQLGALEWVFPKIPAKPPIPGAKYGAFAAACHYADGTFVPAAAQAKCAATSPTSGAKFTFWHGPLVTLHVWLWYPNPSGLFSGTNPFVTPYNQG
jgi:hypothetical protein